MENGLTSTRNLDTSFRSETQPENHDLVPMVCDRTEVYVSLLVVVGFLSTGFAARTVGR